VSDRCVRAGVLAILTGPALLPGSAAAAVRGLVVDEDQHPVAGASVRLSAGDADEAFAGGATTDKRGRWVVADVPPGRWRLTVDAPGFETSTGWTLAAEGSTPLVRVMLLRDLTATTDAWVEAAGRLLEAGRIREARAQYERALEARLEPERPPLLMAIARTRFLEGDTVAAVELLKEALLLAPDSAVARTLLLDVAGRSGRQAAVGVWLGRLDRGGPGPLLGERIPVHELKRLDDRPTGRFRARLSETSPWSSRATIEARVGGGWLGDRARTPPAEEEIEVYVPGPGPGGRYGLFVWISPTPYGHVPQREMLELLDARGVIWAGADRSGNNREVIDRLGLALDTAHAVQRAYPVDPARVWVGGYSGGGRVASALAVCYPDVFRGGVFYMGTDSYHQVPVPHRPGALWPAAFKRPAERTLQRAKAGSRLVFVTGEFDFNRPPTRAILEAFRNDGFEHLQYVELPEVGHHYGFRRDGFEQALDALEREPRR
jgi:hypothetical protein